MRQLHIHFVHRSRLNTPASCCVLAQATGADVGSTYELPSLGKLSYENAVAYPYTYSDTTVVVSADDSTPGQVYVYYGTKQSAGSDIVKAGLTGGKLYGIKVANFVGIENATAALDPNVTTFSLADLGDVTGLTGAQLEASSTAQNVSQ